MYDGRRIIEEAGGRKKYKEMMKRKLGLTKPDLPKKPSIEEIKEFRKKQEGTVVSAKV